MLNYSQIALRTPRLVLRPMALADAPQLYAMHSDALFMRYWSSLPWTTPEQATALIERDTREMAANESVHLGVYLHARPDDGIDDGTGAPLIGIASLFRIHAQCRRAEIGYGIAQPHWRQGYMTEAVSALIDTAFGVLELNRLEAEIDPRNSASGSGLSKLGFTREGYLRERWIVGSEVTDSAVYGLLAREWAQNRH